MKSGRISLGVEGHTFDKVYDGEDHWVAIHEWHPSPMGECGGFVAFDTPEAHLVTTPQSPKWMVKNWDPLTLTPSLLCRRCGNHGFITSGVWEAC